MPKPDPNISIVFDNMVSEWGIVPYPQLSVILVHLKFLATVHQTHHWVSRGDTFYGDHLLFQRLYETVSSEIDALAEKSVGMGTVENVNITLQTAQVMRLVTGYGMTSTIPQPSELASRSLAAENNFLKTTELALAHMREMGMLTSGIENLLAGMLDVHESHVYLLKQRCT
jgi:DNA-binding ferritin-like protein